MPSRTVLSPADFSACVAPPGFSASAPGRLATKLSTTPSECWTFTGARRSGGYGNMTRGAKGGGNEAAHRLAWMLVNGPIPDGKYVLHRCDNPPCCNPAHLFLGTLRDNTQDMLAKGRHRVYRGEDHPQVRLSDQAIGELRRLAPIVDNHAELGRRFGISKQYARAIVLGHQR